MLARCTKQNGPGYANYGGRGIQVCDRWRESIEAFVADMGPRPSAEHSIDRIDNDGNYEPGNCRWATSQEQARNMRCNRKLTASNGETLLACEWEERLGISHQRLYQRLGKMPEHVAVSYSAHGTSPEREAWMEEMKLKYSEWKWRDRHLKKLAKDFERLLRGAPIVVEPQRLTHAKRRERRREIADFVRNGGSVHQAAEKFGVGLHTVINALQEFATS